MNKKNRDSLLDNVHKISEMVKSNCGSLCMDSEDDRARMALFIYDNFCLKDWRISFDQYNQGKGPMPGREDIKNAKFGGDVDIKMGVDFGKVDADETIINDDEFKNG